MIKTTKKFYDNRFPTNQNSLIKGFNFFQVNKLNVKIEIFLFSNNLGNTLNF